MVMLSRGAMARPLTHFYSRFYSRGYLVQAPLGRGGSEGRPTFIVGAILVFFEVFFSEVFFSKIFVREVGGVPGVVADAVFSYAARSG
jgi:hypothetical protein